MRLCARERERERESLGVDLRERVCVCVSERERERDRERARARERGRERGRETCARVQKQIDARDAPAARRVVHLHTVHLFSWYSCTLSIYFRGNNAHGPLIFVVLIQTVHSFSRYHLTQSNKQDGGYTRVKRLLSRTRAAPPAARRSPRAAGHPAAAYKRGDR